MAPRASSILNLEEFVDKCTGLTSEERMRMKLAATEVYENILMHTRSLFNLPVTVCYSRCDTVKLSIRYYSANIWSPGLPESRMTPYYDHEARRYRGLGLRMCSCLSRGIAFRKGLFIRVITIIL